MDFAKLDTTRASEDGAFLHLRHPATDKPLIDTEVDKDKDQRVGFLLRGVDSQNYRHHLAKTSNRMIKANIGAASRRNNDAVDVTAESMESDTTDRLVACFISAINAEVEGKAVVSASDFRQLITQQPWVREQVNEFVSERANFLLSSPKV